MASPQKIEKLRKQARLLWPKYDPDLDTQVNGRERIHDYIQHIFTSADLQADYRQLRKEQDLDGLIDEQAQKGVKNDTSARKGANQIGTKSSQKMVSLNQAQVLAVVDEMYGMPSAAPAGRIAASGLVDKKKGTKGLGQAQPLAAGGPAGDYADYYKRIREMAKDKGMKEDDVLQLLKER